jgi:endonuclease/exonuclease/phosphatase family metal-dependent hydrolase
MNFRLATTLILGLLASGISAAEPVRFSIATWNLEWFFDENTGDNFSELGKQQSAPSRAQWDWKRDAVAAAVAKLNVDLFALQEIENGKVLWYLTRALSRNHMQEFEVAFSEGRDAFTEQDVGFLFRNVEPAKLVRHFRPGASDNEAVFFDVSKHLEFECVVDPKKAKQRLLVLNVHLRSKPEGAELRQRQARLIRHWIQGQLASGSEVIILGDTNTEKVVGHVDASSDLGILLGLDTADVRDDLIDLHTRLPAGQGQTHLLPERQFDRILVSPGLVQDAPDRLDLVLSDVQVRKDVCIRGTGPDEQTAHWETYWAMPEGERDISDHYPLVATFELK